MSDRDDLFFAWIVFMVLVLGLGLIYFIIVPHFSVPEEHYQVCLKSEKEVSCSETSFNDFEELERFCNDFNDFKTVTHYSLISECVIEV